MQAKPLTATLKKYHQLRRDVIKYLYFHKSLTITELSKLIHKSVPIVTSAVMDLIAEGYVLESALSKSTGGRRAVMYLINPAKKRFLVSVAMDQLVTRVVIYDLLNNVRQGSASLSFTLTENPEDIEILIKFLKGYLQQSNIPVEEILGIGIGMPGFINTKQGINYTFFKLKNNGSLRNHLSKELGLPVFIDNDSSLTALAELRFGAGQNLKEVLVVNVGWGSGLGMIINGSLFRGHSGFAGEFSHIPLSQTNKLCSCGKRGCLEVDTSLLVLVERAEKEIANGVSSRLEALFKDKSKLPGDHFLVAARDGDPLAVSILSEAAFLIGKGIATLIHIMNPELIVVAGRGAIAGKILMAPIQQAMNEFCISRIADQTTIVVSDLADTAELLGAAILIVENCQFN
ncbi:ROK family protein [Pedobacter psychroterrae]|uniref:ROK family protein n=1 Tax=Pedobacter psychroterrae TaxID=2530453 RepID=A0A4R0NPN0_9SPHI|nr:ROK family protein [Pedobacter psychroterrae]TCD02756.1 ROK family protein [Pedobacter psychroterrae]